MLRARKAQSPRYQKHRHLFIIVINSNSKKLDLPTEEKKLFGYLKKLAIATKKISIKDDEFIYTKQENKVKLEADSKASAALKTIYQLTNKFAQIGSHGRPFVPLVYSACYCTCVLLQLAGVYDSEIIGLTKLFEEILENDQPNLSLLLVFSNNETRKALSNVLFLYEQIGVIRKNGAKYEKFAI